MPKHILIDDRAEYILICLVKNAIERNKKFATNDDVLVEVSASDPEEIILTDPYTTHTIGSMDRKGELIVQITDQGEFLTQNNIKQTLGTSVLKLVIKVLGGKLTVHSGSQQTTFLVRFPCKC